MISKELEHLENLVKLAKQKKDLNAMNNQMFMVSATLTFKNICINKMHRNKSLYLLMEINNYVVEKVEDIGASMSIMAAIVVREWGIMHLVTKSKTYKTASGVVTQVMGRIDEVPVKVISV
jgi:hypothetical protein